VRVISADEVRAALDFPTLIERLRTAFRDPAIAPTRHHHEIGRGDGPATLLLMPAWDPGAAGGPAGHIGVKAVTVMPGNAARTPPKPSVLGVYLLLSGETGEPLALIDGAELTLRRTAAASALAASWLARGDAARLAMLGAGALAPHLIEAHMSVRPITEIAVWNRTPGRAVELAGSLARRGIAAAAIRDREQAVRDADVISCATISSEPLVHGAWLSPGAHVDLVGAFRPALRESDDEVMRRGRVFVDTRQGALAEAGDIVQAIAAGAMTADDIVADLTQLARGDKAGRGSYDQITVFKSVGHALEDLAAARLVLERT
jgi:ornithine cyclodeaminase